MNKNEIFRRFLHTATLNNLIELPEDQMQLLNVNSECSDPLINIIRISILSLEHNPSVDYASRKINQFMRKDDTVNKILWEEND